MYILIREWSHIKSIKIPTKMTPSSPFINICSQDLTPLFVDITFARTTPSSKKKYVIRTRWSIIEQKRPKTLICKILWIIKGCTVCTNYNYLSMWPIILVMSITLHKKRGFPLRIFSVNVTRSHLLKKYLMENFIFCAVLSFL